MQDEYSARCIFAQMPAISIWTAVQLSRLSILHELSSTDTANYVPLPLAPYTEPKIEPEIMFGLAAAPSPGMDDAALLSCIAWVAHGFEIVQSIFPDWKFSAADTIVADAMHGALLVGPHHDIGARAGEWLRTLKSF